MVLGFVEDQRSSLRLHHLAPRSWNSGTGSLSSIHDPLDNDFAENISKERRHRFCNTLGNGLRSLQLPSLRLLEQLLLEQQVRTFSPISLGFGLGLGKALLQ